MKDYLGHCFITRKFFFWGIFTDKERVNEILGRPKSFTRVMIGKKQGVIVDFSNKTNEEFAKIMGILASIEKNYFQTTLSVKDVGLFYMYIPLRCLNNTKTTVEAMNDFLGLER